MKRFLVMVIAFAFIFGCSNTKLSETIETTMTDEMAEVSGDSYPQMYSDDMRGRLDAVQDLNDVTFLGAYDDTVGGWIMWVEDNKTGKCYATIIIPPNFYEDSCGGAYEMYLKVCPQVGNCI